MKWLSYPALLMMVISGVSADVTDLLPGDSRLDQRVTLEMNHVKLEEVAESLSKQSGVDIKAGTGTRDWKVRERKVTIHAKDIQLGKVMDEISRLVGFHISRQGKDGEWDYLIWQDQKARIYEEEMLIAAKEAHARQASQVRQGALDAAAEALKMTPDEALKRRDKEPLAAFLGGTGSGRGFAQILSALQSNFPTEYELMMRGKRVTIPVSDFPLGLQGAVAGIMAGRLPSWMEPDEKSQLVPQEFVIEPMRGPDAGLNAMLGLGGLAFLYARPGQGGDSVRAGYLPMSGVDSKIGNLFGSHLLNLEEGMDPAEASRIAQEAETAEGLAELMARKSPSEADPPTEPELLREIEILEVTGSPDSAGAKLMENQGKMMGEIARAAEIAVLLESYITMTSVSAFIKKGKQPLYHILIAAEKAGCTWELGEGILRIRPEDWAIHRSKEISEGFSDYYKSVLIQNGGLNLDDLGAIAAGLTDSQIEGGLRADPELGPILTAITDDKGRRDFLRAYGSMDMLQKSAVSSAEGLPFVQLTDKQWGYLQAIITDRLGGIQIVGGSISIVPRAKEGERPDTEIFELRVQTPDAKPRSVKTWVNVPTKAFMKRMHDQRKKAQEAPDSGP